MQPAIFLDRDGVIIENLPNYIRDWTDVVPLPQALEAQIKNPPKLQLICRIPAFMTPYHWL